MATSLKSSHLLINSLPLLPKRKMWLNPPKFWGKKNAVMPLALQPLSCIYSGITYIRNYCASPVAVARPVICMGNITTGGAGKTPVAIAIHKILQDNGKNTSFLSRGYGGSLTGPHLVNPETNTADEVGDEPLLLSRYAPTWIARNRIDGANAAIEHGADIIIMDDGFQNPSISKDLSFLVIDGNYGLGNGHILPAGPLRETLASALQRTQAVVIIGTDIHNIAKQIPQSIPVLYATIQPQPVANLHGKKCVAFAGIGNPQKFFITLESIGAQLVSTHSFPDHYPYSQHDINILIHKARASEAILITTEKDWLRLPKHLRAEIRYLPIEIQWEDEAEVRKVLMEKHFL